MSKFLMSAAAAALMSAPALAQADQAQESQQSNAAQERQPGQSENASATAGAGASAAGREQAGRAEASAQDEAYDWDTGHDWVKAAVYGEDGDQIGVVDRVRMRAGGGGEVRALVLNTDGFLDQGMRHIRLLGDEATVITQDKLPEGWTVSRAGADGGSNAQTSEDDGEERRWWNWGRDDDDEAEQTDSTAGSSGAMDSFTLITLDFTNDEIGMMPQYTAPSAMQSADAGSSGDTDTDTETSIASDTTEGGSMTAEGDSAMSGQRADSRRATQQAAQTARTDASNGEAMAANAGQTGDPMGESSGSAMSDEDSEEFQSEYGNEIGEDASDGYDREVRAAREDVGTSNDTGVNMQNGDAPDDTADSTLMNENESGQTGQSGETSQSTAASDMTSEDMNSGSTDMQRANRGGQAGDAADADNGAMTANDSQSGQAWADDRSPAEQGRDNAETSQTGQQSSAMSGQDSAMSGSGSAMASGQTTASAGAGSSQSWTEDNTLVGQDVYAQDETRLGSVGRVQEDGAGTQAEPIALIIVTDTMGEREVSLEDRDWSNQQREGETSLTLDYQDQSAFEQDSAPYGEETVMDQQDQPGQQDSSYGQSDEAQPEDGVYAEAAAAGGAASQGWTDDHEWVDTAVYSRTGSQIGEIERIRGGANGAQPTALVIETNGFLDIGGREVELNGSNFRLTDYEGEQVLQIRYTEEEVEQMQAFDESEVSDYPLSDNPLESDGSEPLDDDGR